MGMTAQKRLFGWEEIEKRGELERPHLALKHLPDRDLLSALSRTGQGARRLSGRADVERADRRER